MYRSKVSAINITRGFSLIELMVVMAIMAVVMSLSGGLFQQSINQQERHVELEKVRQLFKQLTYNAYYQGKAHQVRLEENKLMVYTKASSSSFVALASDDIDNEPFESVGIESFEREPTLIKVIAFNQLTFVAQDFQVTTKGIVHPNQFSVFTKQNIRAFPLSSVFVSNE